MNRKSRFPQRLAEAYDLGRRNADRRHRLAEPSGEAAITSKVSSGRLASVSTASVAANASRTERTDSRRGENSR